MRTRWRGFSASCVRDAIARPCGRRRAGGAVQAPTGDEEEVREAVQVAPRRLAHLLALAELDQRALGAPADGARKMCRRGRSRAARQDEFLERRQLGVPALDGRFQALDLRLAEDRVARDADFAAQVEEIVLHVAQGLAHLRRRVFGEHQADGAVQLVQVAQGAHPRRRLGDARAVAEAGLAAIAGARGDLRQAMRHASDYRSSVFFTLLCTLPCARVVKMSSPCAVFDASRSTLPAASRVML